MVVLVLGTSLLVGGCTETRSETLAEPIPYETVEEPAEDLWIGETEVLQVGSEGEKTLTYNVKYRDDVEVERALVTERVTLEPVNETRRVGTKNPATGRQIQVKGATLTLTRVERVAERSGVTGDFLNLTFHVDNSDGTQLFTITGDANPWLLWEGQWYTEGTLSGTRSQWRGSSAEGRVRDILYLKAGESGDITLTFDVNRQRVRENTAVRDPKTIRLCMTSHSGDSYYSDSSVYVNAPLSGFWLKPLSR